MEEERTYKIAKKVNVWMEIVGNHVLGSLSIRGNLNGDNYLAPLKNYILLTLSNIYPGQGNPLFPRNLMWFWQDGEPPHHQLKVLQYLDLILPNRWIDKSDLMMLTETLEYYF